MRVLRASMQREGQPALEICAVDARGGRARRASLRAVAWVAMLGLVPGCAQVITRSSVEIMERPDAAALVVGPPGGEITSRGVRAGWSQDGDRLTVRIEESRTCNSVRHVPVVRIERVDKRTARGAMWFEYGFGATAMVGGLIGLIRPEWFSQSNVVNESGQVLEDKRTGYRIGGIFTGIGTLLLTAAVIDTFRTRDEVRYADAYRREEGGVVECMDPLAPVQGQTVELLVGKWSTVEPTDDGGGARFLLPGVEDLPEDARKVIEATAAWDAAKAAEDEAARVAAEEEAARLKAEAEAAAKAAKKGRKGKASAGKKGLGLGSIGMGPTAGSGNPPPEVGVKATGEVAAPAVTLGPRPAPMVVKGVLRLDTKRALAVSFVVPYADVTARGYEGTGAMDPGPSGGAAPREGKGLTLEGAGTGGEDAGSGKTGSGADADADADTRDSSKTGDVSPSETSKTGAGKTGEPSIKLGGSGSNKGGETSIKLGGSGSNKGGTSKTGEAP
jgi:hypothetical protein